MDLKQLENKKKKRLVHEEHFIASSAEVLANFVNK
jgi:hypothetical protein